VNLIRAAEFYLLVDAGIWKNILAGFQIRLFIFMNQNFRVCVRRTPQQPGNLQ
jgi:hypothetical protein